ncbi:hypothetical protein BOSEA1005_12465 [Hyphomicrobiales bacterium]|nr:hypothetical protein BOSEA1005_12465 [Hyphomicrobiales bacterium]
MKRPSLAVDPRIRAGDGTRHIARRFVPIAEFNLPVHATNP